MAGFDNDVLIADNVDFRGVTPTGAQVLMNGQLLIGSAAAPNIRVGTLTSTGGTITVTPGAGTINLEVAGGGIAMDSVQVDAATGPGVNPVVPDGAGLMTISGAVVAALAIPIRTHTIAVNSFEIQVQTSSATALSTASANGLAHFDSSMFTVDANGFVQLAGGGLPFDEINVQATTLPGVTPVTPSGTGALTLSGATVAAGAVPVQSRSVALNQLQIEVQRAADTALTDATSQGLSSFNSAHFSVDANGWVSLAGGGLAIDQIAVDAATGPGVTPVDPDGTGLVTFNGLAVAAQAIPVRTHSVALNQLRTEVQISSAVAATDATQNGLSHFSSLEFQVDANGFVENLNGLPFSTVTIDAFTGPGVNPVTPSAAGNITVTGVDVAALGVPLQTQSLALNSYEIQVQRSSAVAATDATQNGVCHFDSSQFTVDANGFVQSLGSPFTWQDLAPGALAINNGYFATGAGAYTLPAGVTDGDTLEIVDQVGGGVVVTAAGGDFIQISNTLSSAGGTATSTQSGDALRLVWRATNSAWISVPSAAGNWNLA